MKTTSLFALAATAGLALSMGSGVAADLGGNCCADLEERIADLEATAARKGNRKVSLTIYGQLNRTITYLDDGQIRKTYFGNDNTNSSSRFGFTGEAKISSAWKAGFDIMIEIEAGGTTSKASQLDEDGKLGTQFGGNNSALGASASYNASNVDAYFGDARHAAFWLEHDRLGRFTLGRWESAGAAQGIDLAGIQSTAASASFSLINGFTFFRSKASGSLTTIRVGDLGDPAAAQGRTELLRWDSPTLHGFIASASIGESGDFWGAMLRYANEFNGVRIAGGIGYEQSRDRATTACVAGTGNITQAACSITPGANGGIAVGAQGYNGFDSDIVGRPNVGAFGIAGAILHVPTGLFAQGHWNKVTYAGDPNGYWGYGSLTNAADKKHDMTHWLIQSGLSRNHFGIGVTSLYGEYGKVSGIGGESGLGRAFTAPNNSVAGSFDQIAAITNSELRIWGIGLVQDVDAAAMKLYLGYRNFSGSVTQGGNGVFAATGTTCATNANTACAFNGLKDINMITAGGLIKF